MKKGMGGHQSANSKTDDWLTPPEIVTALAPFDLDPCSPVNRPWPTATKHYTINDNGLLQPWEGNVWLNPPYSQLGIWMKKLAFYGRGMALTFARTDRMEFHEYVFPIADSIFFVRRRIVFCNVAGMRAKYDGGAPSIFIAYREENSDKLAQSGFKGNHVPLNHSHIIVVGISPKWITIVTIAVNQCGDEEMKPVYDMVERIAPDKVAANQHWKAKIRQTIQVIRKKRKNVTEITIELN